MSETVIIKPDITPEERLKKLNEVAAVLTGITGYKCEYTGEDKGKQKKREEGKSHKLNEIH
jgi:hypothetical protein